MKTLNPVEKFFVEHHLGMSAKEMLPLFRRGLTIEAIQSYIDEINARPVPQPEPEPLPSARDMMTLRKGVVVMTKEVAEMGDDVAKQGPRPPKDNIHRIFPE